MNDSDEIRILLDEILARQRELDAVMSRLEKAVEAFDIKLANFGIAVIQEVARIRMMTVQRRRLLDTRRIT